VSALPFPARRRAAFPGFFPARVIAALPFARPAML
jgi:hypothetical protein